MAWWAILPPLAAGLLVLLVPGGLLGWASGLRGLTLAAAAAPITVALVGAVGVLAGLLGVPFGWWWILVASVALGGVVVGIRRLRPARPEAASALPAHQPSLGPVLLATLVSTTVVGVVSFAGVPSPERFSQTYDGVFHLNAVASILANGDASSLDLYSITHAGGGLEFYPSGWHSVTALIAQLSGASVPAAANAAYLAGTGAIWVLGCAWLTGSIFPPSSRRSATALASAGALLAAAFPAFPYLLLDWGTLYPTWLAYALLPSGLAITLLALRSATRRGRMRWWSLLAVWLVASVFAHPRSLATYAVLVAPLAVLAVSRLISAAARRSGRPWVRPALWAGLVGGLLAAAGAALAVVLVYYDVGHRPISDHLNGGPATATQTLGTSALQALAGAAPSAAFPHGIFPALVVSALSIGGVLLAVRTPVGRCLALSWLALLLLYTLAAGSNDDLAKLATGIWYKDKFRLITAIPVLGVPFASAAVVWVVRRVRGAAPVSRRVGRAAVGAAMIGAALLSPSLAAMATSIGTVFALPAGEKRGYLTNADEVALLTRLPDLTPPGAVIVGDPWNGSTLSWALGGRRSLFPHLAGDWDADRLTVAASLDRIKEDPAVCAALDRLGAFYLLRSDGLMWGGAPEADSFSAIDRAAAAGIGTRIASQGGTTLYRIDECG